MDLVALQSQVKFLEMDQHSYIPVDLSKSNAEVEVRTEKNGSEELVSETQLLKKQLVSTISPN